MLKIKWENGHTLKLVDYEENITDNIKLKIFIMEQARFNKKLTFTPIETKIYLMHKDNPCKYNIEHKYEKRHNCIRIDAVSFWLVFDMLNEKLNSSILDAINSIELDTDLGIKIDKFIN